VIKKTGSGNPEPVLFLFDEFSPQVVHDNPDIP
jgi:hypothetical protein